MFAILALAIGVIAGLRALCAPLAIAWAARFGWLDVHATWAAFLARAVTPWVVTALALGELVNDQNPKAGSRLAPPSFVFRTLSGAFCGVVLGTGSGHSPVIGGVLGGVGAIIGTLGGYRARTGLVRSLKVRDLAIALPEDLLAIAGGFLIVAAFR